MRTISLILLIVICGCNDAAKEKNITKEKATAAVQVKQTISQLNLADLNNQRVDLKQYKDKTIFINFWATWCKPCIQEMPAIKKAQELLSKETVVFLFASNDSPELITEFEKEYNYDFNYLRIGNMEELKIDALPTTFIFNPAGELVFSEMGYKQWDDPKNIEMILKINDQK